MKGINANKNDWSSQSKKFEIVILISFFNYWKNQNFSPGTAELVPEIVVGDDNDDAVLEEVVEDVDPWMSFRIDNRRRIGDRRAEKIFVILKFSIWRS